MADKFNFDDYDYYDLSSLYSALNDHDDHAIETTTKENTADTIIMVTDTVNDLTSTMATTTTGEVISTSTTAMLPTPATPTTPRLATAALALWMPFTALWILVVGIIWYACKRRCQFPIARQPRPEV